MEVWTVVWDRVPLVDFGDWEEGRREGAPDLRLLVWSGDLPVGTRGRDNQCDSGMCIFLGPGLWRQAVTHGAGSEARGLE